MIKFEKEEFRNSCKEVLEILKFVNEKDLEKIPKFEIEILKKNENKNHKFTYNPNLTLNEQNVSKLTKAIIARYFEKYTATDRQKKIIMDKRNYDNNVIEQRKSAEYGQFDLFKNYSKDINSLGENNKLVPTNNEKWYKRLWDKIKKILWRNKKFYK